MTSTNKRFLGISMLLMLGGAFKIYSKGLYDNNGEFLLFNLLVPFGMGVGALVYTLIKIFGEKNHNR